MANAFLHWFAADTLALVEFGLLAILGAVALAAPRLGARWFAAIERAFGQLARRRTLAVLLVGLLPLIGRLAMWWWLPIRQPAIHDEFAYLLLADTFASGRLTNPTPPLWMHFESMPIIFHPTYSATQPVAQGLILAAGQVVTGHPWWGVWLSVGLMCAAICWMLQAWLPPGWALLGGILAALRWGIFSYWMNSYWGGAPAAIGGALVLGALPRITRIENRGLRIATTEPQFRSSILHPLSSALWLALGLAILANSRPYEGFVLSLPVAVALLRWMLGRSRPPAKVSLGSAALPILLVLSITAAAMGYYCWRVTGSPFRLPDQLSRDTYGVAGRFLWHKPGPEPAYHHPWQRRWYVGVELAWELRHHSLGGLAALSLDKARNLWLFFLGPALTLPFVMFSGMVRDRRVRFLLVAGSVELAALAPEVWIFPHYAAPIAGLIMALVMQLMRHLRVWRRGRRTGVALTRAVVLVFVLMFLVRVAAGPLHDYPRAPYGGQFSWCCVPPGNLARAYFLEKLGRLGGRHLVFVRYAPDHNLQEEWVYNRADLDRAAVIWAREMGAASDQELIRLYPDRRVWMVEPDHKPPILESLSH